MLLVLQYDSHSPDKHSCAVGKANNSLLKSKQLFPGAEGRIVSWPMIQELMNGASHFISALCNWPHLSWSLSPKYKELWRPTEAQTPQFCLRSQKNTETGRGEKILSCWVRNRMEALALFMLPLPNREGQNTEKTHPARLQAGWQSSAKCTDDRQKT